MKKLQIFLLVLIVVGVLLLLTKNKWLEPLTNYILHEEGSVVVDKDGGHSWKGTIDSIQTTCIVDGVCSITVSGRQIIFVRGMVPLAPNEQVGKLIGLDDAVGDPGKYIGKKADVYVGTGKYDEFTIFGSSDYYVKLID